MAEYYFSSCKMRKYSPENTRKLEQYLQEKHALLIAGCCRLQAQSLKAGDTAYYICNTCAAILREVAPQVKVQSIWELLVEDQQFEYPDYQGQCLSVQDCWRVYDNLAQQLAVRKILELLNIQACEITANFAATEFCGTSLLEELPEQNARLAPKRFLKIGKEKFKVHSEIEKKQLMQTHCQQFKTDQAICYCLSCIKGITLGGIKVKHLLDLIFAK